MVIDNAVDKMQFDMATGLEFPHLLGGKTAPNGAGAQLAKLPVGSRYCQWISKGVRRWYTKRKNDGRTDDWVLGAHEIVQRVLFSAFTDGGAAVGTLDLTETIPIGAWVHQSIVTDVTGFTGNVSAVMTIGDGSDVDRYNTGTPSVFTTTPALDMGVPSGTKLHTVAATIRLTVTASADFTAVVAGAATVRIHLLGG